tara:strand:+ start:5468 stop:7369 length:1902 start_codon:yes stop_codon:yes gene_type:complete
MEKIEFELVADTKKSDKNIKNVNKGVVDLNKNLAATSKDAKDGMSAIDDGAKKASKSSFKLGKVLKGAFVIFGGAGIVAIAVKIFQKFYEVLQENQKVVNLFAVATEAVSIVMTDLINFFISNFNVVTDFMNALFKDPQKTITEFAKQIQQGVIDRFNQLLEVFGLVGKALSHLVKGEFGEAFESIKTAGKEVVDVYTGVDKSFEKVAEAVTKYTTATLKTAKANVELANSAELAATKNQGLLEQFDFQNEKLRQIRDEERNTIEERIKANNDLRDNLEKQQELMLANAQISIDSANAQLAKDKDNIQFKKELMEAENELAAVKATVAGFESEFKANDMALDKEKIELTNSKLESESTLSIEKKRFNAELIEDEYKRLNALKEIDILEAEQETLRLEAIVDNANAGTQAKVDAQIALDDFTEQSRQTNLTRDTEISEANKTLLEQETAQKQKNLDDAISIAGSETKMGKVLLLAKQAIAVKEMIMDAKKTILKAKNAVTDAVIEGGAASTQIVGSVAKSANTAPPPFNIPFILAAVATGIGIMSSVKSAISATKQAAAMAGGGIGGGGSSIVEPSAPAVSTPPAFNIVGASDTNQLADAIGGQSQQPIQTYVVANDVTTAQSLERNIIDSATI